MHSAALLLAIAVAVAPAQAGAPARDTGSPAGAVVSGRVTEQATGQPLPRIVVSLALPDYSKTIQAITDADGRYRLSDIAPGKYLLWAAPDAHRSTFLQRWYGDPDPAIAARTPNIELKPGDDRSGVDFALVRALAIEGRVVDPWGEPMADVEVMVRRADGGLVAVRPAATDDLGAYRAYGLPPGRYRVCARPPGGRFEPMVTDGARFVTTCHPAAAIERESTDVVLGSVDAAGVDIRVQRVGSHAISGFVIDAAGAPVNGADVGAYSLDEDGLSAHAVSRDGEFTLRGLTPGRYNVRGSVGGAMRGDPNPPSREMEVGYAPADVGSTDTTGIALMLSKPVAATGRVVFDGAPAPRADRLQMVVQTRPSDHRAFRYESRPPYAAVDDNLRFELKGLYRTPLAVGIYNLPEGWVLKSVRHGGRDITHLALDFGSAPADSPIEIVLTNSVARPSVRVIDERGALATPHSILVIPADPSRRRLGTVPIMGKPAPDGTLQLDRILPGEYVLVALAASDFSILMRDPDRADSLAAVGTRVSLAEGDTRTIDLRLVPLPVTR
jgi:protocatechuate 3,4-dioxygenase beta subunit